jgi:hypothetical protein
MWRNNAVCCECFELHKNKCGIHKSTNMQLIELLLCGISVYQSPEILCEPGNNLKTKYFQHWYTTLRNLSPPVPTGYSSIYVSVKFTLFSYRLRTRAVSCFNNKYLPVRYENCLRFRHCCSLWFQRRYVDVHHAAVGDGHSAGYEVILMISFVICHDKQARKWGQNGAWVSERRRRSKAAGTLEPEPTQHNSLDRLRTRK